MLTRMMTAARGPRLGVSRPANTVMQAAFSSQAASIDWTAPVASLPAAPTAEELAQFDRDGFLVVRNVIHRDFVQQLHTALDKCFATDYDTEIWPDELHWRKETSLPHVTRHGTNFWKGSRTIARLSLDAHLARYAAQLMRWRSGARMGNDSVWYKPAGAGSEVAFHADSWYIPMPSSITAWVALTDVKPGRGTLEYWVGSHKLPTTAIPRDEFHGAAGRGYRATAYTIAAAHGIPESSVRFAAAEVPAGSVVFHDARLLHGSDVNRDATADRKSIGVHLIPADSVHAPGPYAGGYIYGRYREAGSRQLSETFFPILWTPSGHRSAWIDNFLTATDY